MKTSKVFKNAVSGEKFTFSYSPKKLESAKIGDVLTGKMAEKGSSYYSLLRHSRITTVDSYTTLRVRVVGEEVIRHWKDDFQCIDGEMVNNGRWVDHRLLVVEKI